MVIATEKIDVLIYNGGPGIRTCGNGITYIDRKDNGEYPYDADIWKVVEDPNDFSMFVVHVGDHP